MCDDITGQLREAGFPDEFSRVSADQREAKPRIADGSLLRALVTGSR